MISLLCYVVLYYNIDIVFKQLYLPYVLTSTNYELISNNHELYFLLKMTSYFILLLYSFILSYNMFVSKNVDRYSVGLMFIYLKYIVDIILFPNMKIVEYEISRFIMWIFTTPLMLKMYCNANNLTLQNINIHYHIIAIVQHIFAFPFKHTPIYIISSIVCSIPELFFLKTLYKYNHLPFTHLYMLIWVIYIAINILDITQLFNPNIIHALYTITNTICKFICIVVISNYNEQEVAIRENMDLQSVHFISHIIKHIIQFEDDNQKLTPFCKELITNCKHQFVNKIPICNFKLKMDLLKKILPLDLDNDVMMAYSTKSINRNKEFKFICVMFMDIVNYTEIAKRYNSNIIFALLDDIYQHFDTIIKKYSYLQKIETIGDAYMVVGDIYRIEQNHISVTKEIILLGLEFIREIKTIKTPDNIPLCIRIGITIGPVNIGILGNEIPRLCVVGNTVNMAARLQSTADTDTIQISNHIYQQCSDIEFDINLQYKKKENVFLKNIGSVVTYTISPPYMPP